MSFFTRAILITVVFTLYLFWRFVKGERRQAIRAALLFVAIASLFLAPMLYRSEEHPIRGNWLQALNWSSYIAMGYLAYLIIYALVADVATNLLKIKASPGRREFLSRTGKNSAIALAAVSTGVGFWEAVKKPQVDRVSVPVDGLPPGLEGLKIAQISDLHVGPTISRERVQLVVEAINELEPDLIAVTGDMVDGSVAQLREDTAPLAGLKARHGVFYCTGNHEFYSGVEDWMKEFARLGFKVLDNRHEVIEIEGSKLVVGGVHDYRAERWSSAGYVTSATKAFEGAPSEGFRLLLAHQPKSCIEAEKAGVNLQLSGHTHAGQFIPFSWIVHFTQPYIQGLNRHAERMWVYVNRGTAWWGPPVRLGVPSEISLLTLTDSKIGPKA